MLNEKVNKRVSEKVELFYNLTGQQRWIRVAGRHFFFLRAALPNVSMTERPLCFHA